MLFGAGVFRLCSALSWRALALAYPIEWGASELAAVWLVAAWQFEDEYVGFQGVELEHSHLPGGQQPADALEDHSTHSYSSLNSFNSICFKTEIDLFWHCLMLFSRFVASSWNFAESGTLWSSWMPSVVSNGGWVASPRWLGAGFSFFEASSLFDGLIDQRQHQRRLPQEKWRSHPHHPDLYQQWQCWHSHRPPAAPHIVTHSELAVPASTPAVATFLTTSSPIWSCSSDFIFVICSSGNSLALISRYDHPIGISYTTL